MAKFKKGDKVVFNGSIHESGQEGYTVGKEYTVLGYWSESQGKVKTDTNTHKTGVWMKEDNFDLALPFKKGDVCIVIDNVGSCFGRHCYKIGDEFTISGESTHYPSDSKGWYGTCSGKTANQTLVAAELVLKSEYKGRPTSPLLQVVCVDNSSSDRVLTVGKEYEVTERGQFYEPVAGVGWDNKSVGGMYKTRFVLAEDYVAPVPVDEEIGQFIIWSPQSDKAPHNIFTRAKQARFVARQMLGKHGGEWYVCKLATKYTSTTEVKKEVL